MPIEFPDRLFHSRDNIDLEASDHGGIGESQANLALIDYFKEQGLEYLDLGVMKDSNASGSDYAFMVKDPDTGEYQLVIGDNKDYDSSVSASAFDNAQERAEQWTNQVMNNPEAVQQLILSGQLPDLEDTGLTPGELLFSAGYEQERIDQLKLAAESGDPDGIVAYNQALDGALTAYVIEDVQDAVKEGRLHVLATTSGDAELSEQSIARLERAGLHYVRIDPPDEPEKADEEDEEDQDAAFGEDELEDDEDLDDEHDPGDDWVGEGELEDDDDEDEPADDDWVGEGDLEDDEDEDEPADDAAADDDNAFGEDDSEDEEPHEDSESGKRDVFGSEESEDSDYSDVAGGTEGSGSDDSDAFGGGDYSDYDDSYSDYSDAYSDYSDSGGGFGDSYSDWSDSYSDWGDSYSDWGDW